MIETSPIDFNTFSTNIQNLFYSREPVHFVVSDGFEESAVELEPDELDYLDKIRSFKRKEEYIKIRKVAKRFVSKVLNTSSFFVKIQGGVKTAPYALLADKIIPLSFSHRDYYYAVSFSTSQEVITGIDIERFKRLDINHLLDFFNEVELKDEDEVIIKWSVKEAIGKMLGVGMKLPAQDIVVLKDRVFLKGRVYDLARVFDFFKVKVLLYNDYVVAVSFGVIKEQRYTLSDGGLQWMRVGKI